MEYSDAFRGGSHPLYVSLAVLSTTAVVLRLIARTKTKTRLRMDDWCSCLALILLQAFLGLSIWAKIKLTKLYDNLPFEYREQTAQLEAHLPEIYKVMYTAGPISISTITAAKISVIFLYRRVFLPDNAFRVASNIVGVLCLLWEITFLFVLVFQCVPVGNAWKLIDRPGYCINSNGSFLGAEILSCVLDFAIVLLPVRVIRKLKLSLAQKIILCLIFIMGSFVGIISIIRMALAYHHAGDGSKTAVFLTHSISNNNTNWLPIQLAMAVICCCLPTYRPLLPDGTAVMASLVGIYSSVSSLILRRQKSAISSTNDSRNVDDKPSTRSYNGLSGHNEESGISVLTNVVGAGAERTEDCVPGRDYPMDAINVTKTVDMV